MDSKAGTDKPMVPYPVPSTSQNPADGGAVPPGGITMIFGKQPLRATCYNCGESIVTNVMIENGACSLLASLLVCLLFFPLLWVPLVIDTCKDYHHICPSCNSVLGSRTTIRNLGAEFRGGPFMYRFT